MLGISTFSPEDQAPPPEPEVLAFTGGGAEYFRIWIVNVTLTVLTLGVYSAWAKVRRQQFFARHTRLAGAGFDYHGPPLAILRGRAVALVLFGAYSLAGYWSPRAAFIAVAALGAVMPWLMRRSLRFRAHNTSYRGLRFRFEGSNAGAYGVFLGLPIATMLSFFLAGPYWHHQMRAYQHDHAGFGRERFTFAAPVSGFYLTYLRAGLFLFMFVIVGAVVAGIAGAVIAAVIGGTSADPLDRGVPFFLVVFMVAALYAAAIVGVQSLVGASVQNLVWNHTWLRQHRFVNRVSFPRLYVIRFTNLAATLLTAGLYRPFAQVRLARYLASCFTFVPARPIDTIEAADPERVGAVGEEAADLFDFDIAL